MSAPLPGWFSAEQEKPIGRPALRRHTRPPAGHPLRGEGSGPQAAHRPQRPRGPSRPGGAGPEPPGRGGRRRIRERLVFSGAGKRGMYLCHGFCELGGTPLELGARRHPRLPGGQSRRGAGDHQRGLRDSEGLRGRGGERGPRRPRVRAPGRRRVAHAAADDRPQPARRVPCREPRRQRPLVPARLRRQHRGDPLRLLQGLPAHRPGEAAGELRAQPRRHGRSAVPDEPLDHHRPR